MMTRQRIAVNAEQNLGFLARQLSPKIKTFQNPIANLPCMPQILNLKDISPMKLVAQNLDSPSLKILTESVAFLNKIAQIRVGHGKVIEVNGNLIS